jgi:hypothetical protein
MQALVGAEAPNARFTRCCAASTNAVSSFHSLVPSRKGTALCNRVELAAGSQCDWADLRQVEMRCAG